ncbi:uncharacterized protein LAESUDRAFT_134692 [Laetiporus sulphureus 93-53]|uniref:Uncharacterized protein n=1 Tax=Laetiporus sulphureus 93-53 TaxID=1314785 RepID=A0A165EIK0_9APHY|nr:uncharacterized protein LAESUDRAFT_134692 [Laetiporus sulphureus 93-53]KZT07126.1 hypothetical protein LAESUDRAFT_134692 [Laetiporus sulphureus 93-53]
MARKLNSRSDCGRRSGCSWRLSDTVNVQADDGSHGTTDMNYFVPDRDRRFVKWGQKWSFARIHIVMTYSIRPVRNGAGPSRYVRVDDQGWLSVRSYQYERRRESLAARIENTYATYAFALEVHVVRLVEGCRDVLELQNHTTSSTNVVAKVHGEALLVRKNSPLVGGRIVHLPRPTVWRGGRESLHVSVQNTKKQR